MKSSAQKQMTKSDLMDLIFERPALYIGHGSVVRMEAFIQGFTFASAISDGKEFRDPIYDGFTQWLISSRDLGQYSWSSIVTMIGGSEARAFQTAKELWTEYKKVATD